MKSAVARVVSKVLGVSASEIESIIEIPKDSGHGDYALPCFSFAKKFKKSPIEIAKEIAHKLEASDFDRIEPLGPYVNFFINQKKQSIHVISNILDKKDSYGSNDIGKGKTFMIEFSQPNTHKAFHVGHIRGTCFGESLARIREFSGYKALRLNYSGDTGMHIAKWIWAYKKFHANERVKQDESWFAKIYVEAVKKLEDNPKGEQEVEEINRALDARSDSKVLKLWRDTRAKSIAAWKPIYKDLDVRFDKHFFESEVEKEGKDIAQQLVKRGIATISDEATIMDLKDYNLGVWVLLRRDGTVLYSAKDLALAKMKYHDYHVDESLVVTSVEQNLHFQQLIKTLELMDFPNWKSYKHLGYESVRFPWGKMSSRTGDNVFYADFRNELVTEAKKEIKKREKISDLEADRRAIRIAVAAMKYSMLKQDIHKIQIFNKEEALRLEGDTGPYLLYTYARAKSIIRKTKVSSKIETEQVYDSERLLVNLLARFPEVVENANNSMAPALVAHYAYDLAQQFNEFYHKCQVIGSDNQKFRVALVSATAQVLHNALSLLGIPVLEQM